MLLMGLNNGLCSEPLALESPTLAFFWPHSSLWIEESDNQEHCTGFLLTKTTFPLPRIPGYPVQLTQASCRTDVNPCPGWPFQTQAEHPLSMCVEEAVRGQSLKHRTGEITCVVDLPKVFFTSRCPESVNMLPCMIKGLDRHMKVRIRLERWCWIGWVGPL